jgi:hypothetical protein
MNGANVGMVQGGGSAGFTSETFQWLRVLRQIFGQELQCHKAPKISVLGFVDHTHASSAEFFDDAIVRDGLVDHWRESYVGETGKSMNAERLAA